MSAFCLWMTHSARWRRALRTLLERVKAAISLLIHAIWASVLSAWSSRMPTRFKASSALLELLAVSCLIDLSISHSIGFTPSGHSCRMIWASSSLFGLKSYKSNRARLEGLAVSVADRLCLPGRRFEESAASHVSILSPPDTTSLFSLVTPFWQGTGSVFPVEGWNFVPAMMISPWLSQAITE